MWADHSFAELLSLRSVTDHPAEHGSRLLGPLSHTTDSLNLVKGRMWPRGRSLPRSVLTYGSDISVLAIAKYQGRQRKILFHSLHHTWPSATIVSPARQRPVPTSTVLNGSFRSAETENDYPISGQVVSHVASRVGMICYALRTAGPWEGGVAPPLR